jgi:hypothetical protein
MRAFLLLLALPLFGCSVFTVAGEDCTLEITNGTADTIWFLYVRDADTDEWGDDLLDSERLEDSETWSHTVSPGTYDIQAEWPSPGSEKFTILAAETCVDGEALGVTVSLTDQD